MKYVIMSGGKGQRWGNYNGITKQEILINNETLLERTCRLIKNNCNDEIIILTNNKNHMVTGCKSKNPEYSTYYKSKYGYELLNEEITYLYGDTLYTEEIIKKVIETKTDTILFFGSSTAAIAVKVVDFLLFKNIIDDNDETISMYNQVKRKLRLNDADCFVDVGHNFYNINTPSDYETLEHFSSNIKNKFISIGIAFDLNSIKEINKLKLNISSIRKIKIKNMSEFCKKINIIDKVENYLKENEVYEFVIEIEKPIFKQKSDKYSDVCEQIKEIKQLFDKFLSNKVYLSSNVIDSTRIKTFIENQIKMQI